MDEQLKNAKRLFYEKNYEEAKELFVKLNEPYEAGLSSLLLDDLKGARELFSIKKDECTASSFGLIVLDILEGKSPKQPSFFQIRSFFEIFVNLLVENKLYKYAQKIIDNYMFFTTVNPETPKFAARVLNANNFNRAVPFFVKKAKEICYYDAEIYYIEASIYMIEKKYEEALNSINECLAFAPEYYPVKRLAMEIEKTS